MKGSMFDPYYSRIQELLFSGMSIKATYEYVEKYCDQYINKAEEEKTEEQDRIDRETRKKLREMEDEEKMKPLPSDTQKKEKKVHQIKIAAQYFTDVCIGRKTFELRKNDRDYKIGDLLEMFEYKDGKCTERAVRAQISYILEGYRGLQDGYCILGISVTSDWYYARRKGKKYMKTEEKKGQIPHVLQEILNG